MTIQAGTHLGPYEILSPLGAGGMGEVYRARDSKLDREVAIKVLPDTFVRDPERVARFQREAKLLASLNHSNIAAIYGFDESNDTRFLVLELVEGETLADRLRGGALPVVEALEVGRQISEALEAAHERGVIHRDLKPANVMVTTEGVVKVLDFGLAKAFVGDTSVAAFADSPTITVEHTRPGVVLGTAAYMSPEQARGKPLDKRTDIWSFGCVLYECLTGRRPFGGETTTDLIAKILERDPDWDTLPPNTPPIVHLLLRRCLQKNRDKRLHDIADARIELEEAIADPTSSSLRLATSALAEATRPPRRSAWGRLLPWALVSASVLALAAVILILWAPWREREPQRLTSRLSINLPPEAPLAPAGSMPFGIGRPLLTLSPDGSCLVYVALVAGRRQLYMRDMLTGKVEAIPGTEGALFPFFSPDGQWVGFFANEKLHKVSLRGGQPEILADADFPFGGTWAADGSIYFTPTQARGVAKVSAIGGPVETVTTPTGEVLTHAWPSVLPGSEALLVSLLGYRQTAVARLTGPNKLDVVLPQGLFARYVRTGHLLYTRGGRLVAVPFDLNRLKTSGDPVVLIHDIRIEGTGAAAQYSLSADGTLIYATGLDASEGFLVWVDRKGRRERLDLPRQRYGAFRLSPDGGRVALPVYDSGVQDIWVYDFGRLDTPTRLTFGGFQMSPVWTNDGRSLLYSSQRADGGSAILLKDVNAGTREGVPLIEGRTTPFPDQLTPDGRELIYHEKRPGFKFDVWRIQVEAGSTSPKIARTARSLLATEHNELFAAVSPDGRWLAYTSDETGRWEVYVATYPELEGRVQISTRGGEEARWNPNGRELVYRWGSQWFAVDVAIEPEFRCSAPRVLFEGPYINVRGYSWDMSPDGERFLVIEGAEQEKTLTELIVLTNFFDELRRRVPTGR